MKLNKPLGSGKEEKKKALEDNIFDLSSNKTEATKQPTIKNQYVEIPETDEEWDNAFFDEGVTQLIGIYPDASFEEAQGLTYEFYCEKDEYISEKVFFQKVLTNLLNFNCLLGKFNAKIESCKNASVDIEWLENKLNEIAEDREEFLQHSGLYFHNQKRYIDESLPIVEKILIKSANNLFGDVSSINNLFNGTEIIHPQMKEQYQNFCNGNQDSDKLDFGNRDFLNLINNYIEYTRLYSFSKEYESIFELFNEYAEDYKYGGKINDSLFRKHNPNIVSLSKNQLEELLNFCLDLNDKYAKKDKLQKKISRETFKNKNLIEKELELQGLSDEEIHNQVFKWLQTRSQLNNTINEKYVKVNKGGWYVLKLVKRLKQSNTSIYTIPMTIYEEALGLINTMSLHALKQPKENIYIYVHKNEIEAIISYLKESSESKKIIEKLISQTFGDKFEFKEQSSF